MASDKKKTVVAQHLYSVPRHVANALDTYGRRRGLKRREQAILKVIEEHPEILRIIEDERLEARRIALNERRRLGLGGQV